MMDSTDIYEIVSELKKILKRNNINIGEELGSGRDGIVYSIGNGKAIKLTISSSEAYATEKIRKHGNLPNFVKIFNVFKFREYSDVFGIVQEKLEDLDFDEKEILNFLFLEEDEGAAKEKYLDDYVDKIKTDVSNGVKQLKNLGIHFLDFNDENFMKDKNETYKLIDLGMVPAKHKKLKILENKIVSNILERSYVSSDVPEKFYFVFDLTCRTDKIVNMFQKNFIEKVKGISDTGEIRYFFWGMARNAVLIMDAKKLLEINKLTRVMYDNPHYLLASNMKALYRILAASGQYHVLREILGHFSTVIEKSDNKEVGNLGYDAVYYGLPNYGWEWRQDIETTNINNLKQLSQFLKDRIDNSFSVETGRTYNISLDDYYKYLYKALMSLGKLYSDEGEWIIKGNGLQIPPNSEVVIFNEENIMIEKLRNIIEKAGHKVTIAERNEFEAERTKYYIGRDRGEKDKPVKESFIKRDKDW